MNTFVWVIGTILALSCVGKLAWLATGNFPERKASIEAWEIGINFALLVWAAILLLA